MFAHNWDTYHRNEIIFIFNLRWRKIELLAASGAHIDSGNGISNFSRFFQIVSWSNFFEHFDRIIGHGVWRWNVLLSQSYTVIVRSRLSKKNWVSAVTNIFLVKSITILLKIVHLTLILVIQHQKWYLLKVLLN